jgi:hypothetical protein
MSKMSEGDKLSQEELDAINKDLENAKKSLSTKEAEDLVSKAKEEGKQEATRELQMKAELEAEKLRVADYEKKFKDLEVEKANQLIALQKRVDELASSKGVAPSAPSQNTGIGHPIDKLSEESIEEIEARSAREFFGPSLDRYGSE